MGGILPNYISQSIIYFNFSIYQVIIYKANFRLAVDEPLFWVFCMWFFWDFCKLLTQTIIHILFNYKLIEFIHPSVIRFSDFDWVKLGLKMGTIML